MYLLFKIGKSVMLLCYAVACHVQLRFGGSVTAVDSLSVRCVGIALAVVSEGGMRVGKGKGYCCNCTAKTLLCIACFGIWSLCLYRSYM